MDKHEELTKEEIKEKLNKLEYMIRVNDITESLIDYRGSNISYLKDAVDKIKDIIWCDFSIEKTDFIFLDTSGRAYNFENEGYGNYERRTIKRHL